MARNYPHPDFPSNEVYDINHEIKQIDKQIEDLLKRRDALEERKASLKRFGERLRPELIRALWTDKAQS